MLPPLHIVGVELGWPGIVVVCILEKASRKQSAISFGTSVTAFEPGPCRRCAGHRQKSRQMTSACWHSIHQSSITTPVHCAVSRELSAVVHGHIQSASSGGGAARRWLARGGRRKVDTFSSLLTKSKWPKAKSQKEKVRALESTFQKVYTLGTLALQDFSHHLSEGGSFSMV